jgi:peroxiredoxin
MVWQHAIIPQEGSELNVKTGALGAALTLGALSLMALAKAPGAQINKPFADFKVRDIRSGKTISMKTAYKGKVVVGIFMQNNCGTTWRYEQKIGKLVADYKAKGVQVVAVHSSPFETDAEIKGQMDSRNLPIPILDDKPTQAIMNYVGAECSPTFFIVDKTGKYRYIGAFDNRPNGETEKYVRPALDAILAGKPVAKTTSRAFG